jgi:multiple sugar transport system substrate-binding protein
MGTRLAALLAVALAALAVGSCGDSDTSDGRATLKWFIAKQPGGALEKIAQRCSDQSNGRYNIEFELLPAQADAQREQLVRRLGAEDKTIDLIGMDVVWTGEFANAGWLREVPQSTQSVVTKDVFDSVLETARFEDKLFAVPIWSNTQLLWYRKDRVDSAPKTWDQMIDAAEKIGPAEGRIQVQANRYEGLVVWANQMIESAGTSILAGPEEVELEEEPTKRALAIMGRLSRSPVADTAITTSNEGSAALSFERGDSAFEINYPFVYPSAKANAPEVFKQLGAAKYPAVVEGEASAPPIGGINVGISKFSRHTDVAFEASECLVSEQNQIEVAKLEGLPPVRADLFERPEVKDIYPGFSDVIRDSIRDAAARPSESPAYQDLSLAIQRALHPTTGIDPENVQKTYDELRDKVESAVKREGLL